MINELPPPSDEELIEIVKHLFTDYSGDTEKVLNSMVDVYKNVWGSNDSDESLFDKFNRLIKEIDD